MNKVYLTGTVPVNKAYLTAGCHNLFYFLSTRIGNKKFHVIMRYYCEDIMIIFFGLEGKLKLTGPFYKKIINEIKEIKAKI